MRYSTPYPYLLSEFHFPLNSWLHTFAICSGAARAIRAAPHPPLNHTLAPNPPATYMLLPVAPRALRLAQARNEAEVTLRLIPPHHPLFAMRPIPTQGHDMVTAGEVARAHTTPSSDLRSSVVQQVCLNDHSTIKCTDTHAPMGTAPHHPIYSPMTGQFTPSSSRSNSKDSMFTMSSSPYGASRSDHGHYAYSPSSHGDSRPPLTSNNSWQTQTGSVGSAASSCMFIHFPVTPATRVF